LAREGPQHNPVDTVVHFIVDEVFELGAFVKVVGESLPHDRDKLFVFRIVFLIEVSFTSIRVKIF
jgi:hypothetical protein